MTFPVEQTWLVLVNLLTDLNKKEQTVPTEINHNISILKTSINFYKTDPTHPDRIKELDRINEGINDIQQKLILIADQYDAEYASEWMEKLKKATLGEELYEINEQKSRFILNTPPGFTASRITLKNPLAEDRIQEIAEEYNLIIEFEEDNILLLFGDDDNIKKSLKEIAPFFSE